MRSEKEKMSEYYRGHNYNALIKELGFIALRERRKHFVLTILSFILVLLLSCLPLFNYLIEFFKLPKMELICLVYAGAVLLQIVAVLILVRTYAGKYVILVTFGIVALTIGMSYVGTVMYAKYCLLNSNIVVLEILRRRFFVASIYILLVTGFLCVMIIYTWSISSEQSRLNWPKLKTVLRMIYFVKALLQRYPEVNIGCIAGYMLYLYVMLSSPGYDRLFIVSIMLAVAGYIYVPYLNSYVNPGTILKTHFEGRVKEMFESTYRHLVVCGGGDIGRRIVKDKLYNRETHSAASWILLLDDKFQVVMVTNEIVVIDNNPVILDIFTDNETMPQQCLYPAWDASEEVVLRLNENLPCRICTLGVAGDALDVDTRRTAVTIHASSIVSTVKNSRLSIMLSEAYKDKFVIVNVVESAAYDTLLPRLVDRLHFVYDPLLLESMTIAKRVVMKMQHKNADGKNIKTDRKVLLVARSKMLYYTLQQLLICLRSSHAMASENEAKEWLENNVVVMTDDSIVSSEMRDNMRMTKSRKNVRRMRNRNTYVLLRQERLKGNRDMDGRSGRCRIVTYNVNVYNYENYIKAIREHDPAVIVVIDTRPTLCIDAMNKIYTAYRERGRDKHKDSLPNIITVSGRFDKMGLHALHASFASWSGRYDSDSYPLQTEKESRIISGVKAADHCSALIKMKESSEACKTPPAYSIELNILIRDTPLALLKVLAGLVQMKIDYAIGQKNKTACDISKDGLSSVLRNITKERIVFRPNFMHYNSMPDRFFPDTFLFSCYAELTDEKVDILKSDVVLFHMHGDIPPEIKEIVCRRMGGKDFGPVSLDILKRTCPLVSTNYPISTMLSHPEEYYKNYKNTLFRVRLTKGREIKDRPRSRGVTPNSVKMVIWARDNKNVGSLLNALKWASFVDVRREIGDSKILSYIGNVFMARSRPTLFTEGFRVAQDALYINMEQSECEPMENEQCNVIALKIKTTEQVASAKRAIIRTRPYFLYVKDLVETYDASSYIVYRYVIDGADLKCQTLKRLIPEEIFRIYYIEKFLVRPVKEKLATSGMLIREQAYVKGRVYSDPHLVTVAKEGQEGKVYIIKIIQHDNTNDAESSIADALLGKQSLDKRQLVCNLASRRSANEILVTPDSLINPGMDILTKEECNKILRMIDL